MARLGRHFRSTPENGTCQANFGMSEKCRYERKWLFIDRSLPGFKAATLIMKRGARCNKALLTAMRRPISQRAWTGSVRKRSAGTGSIGSSTAAGAPSCLSSICRSLSISAVMVF